MKRSNANKGVFFRLVALIIGILLLVAMVWWVMAWAFNSLGQLEEAQSVDPSEAVQVGLAQVTNAQAEADSAYATLYQVQQDAVDTLATQQSAAYQTQKESLFDLSPSPSGE